ncbi:MAG: hypothetical protein PUA87_01830 [Oscillospiraceae bacterium]|nr:hypothetical protein [Oscillospiraceae bacterium]
MNGHKFLKVTGILMIIGGALSAILGIVAVLGVAALAYIASAQTEAGMLYASTILLLISGVVELIAGIIGVINAEKPQKAKACIVWGALVAILSVAGTILGVVGGSDFSVSGLVLGLVLPVIYIIGAVKNMQSATSVG